MVKSKIMFGGNNDIVSEVENATSEKTLEEDWGTIIKVCDRAASSSEDAKQVLRCIFKRLGNSDPHIGVKAVTLLDACIKNAGKVFHIEVASREFETEIIRQINKGNQAVTKKLKESLKRWAENEFKSDSQLNLIPSLYNKLKNQGHDFSSSEPPKRQTPISKDPNVVESQEEEEQIFKAIELSLKESSGSPRTNTSSSLYPSVSMSSGVSNSGSLSAPAKEPRKVRALYDFEAVEDNELTFNTGEIICVIDDSDANWWKGSNQRGEGLFPANFVTADLSAEPEEYLYDKSKKSVQFKEDKSEPKEPEVVEINEDKIKRLLHLLHEADPTNPDNDTDEMIKLEGEVNAMGPLIDTELEQVDRKHAQLTQLSADLVEALNLYHTLMREPAPVNKVSYGYNPPPPNMMTSAFPAFGPHVHPPVGVLGGPGGLGGPSGPVGPGGPGGPAPPLGHPIERPPFMHQGPLPQMPHYPPVMSGPPQHGQMPPPPGHMPPGQGMPQNMTHPDERRNDMRFQNMPFIHPNMAPTPNFQQTQGPLPGGPPQGLPPYIQSSTHIMQ